MKKFLFCSEWEKIPRSPVNLNLTWSSADLLLLLLLVELGHVERLVNVLREKELVPARPGQAAARKNLPSGWV